MNLLEQTINEYLADNHPEWQAQLDPVFDVIDIVTHNHKHRNIILFIKHQTIGYNTTVCTHITQWHHTTILQDIHQRIKHAAAPSEILITQFPTQ